MHFSLTATPIPAWRCACTSASKAFTSTRNWSVASPQRANPEGAAADLPRPERFRRGLIAGGRDQRRSRRLGGVDPARFASCGAQQICQRGGAAVQVAPSRPAGDPVDRRWRAGRSARTNAFRRRCASQSRRTARSPIRRPMCWRPICAKKATASNWRLPRWSRG